MTRKNNKKVPKYYNVKLTFDEIDTVLKLITECVQQDSINLFNEKAINSLYKTMEDLHIKHTEFKRNKLLRRNN